MSKVQQVQNQSTQNMRESDQYAQRTPQASGHPQPFQSSSSQPAMVQKPQSSKGTTGAKPEALVDSTKPTMHHSKNPSSNTTKQDFISSAEEGADAKSLQATQQASDSSSYKKKRPSQIQTASVKQTLSSQAQSVDKNQGVVTIPEVTERDELTVQQDTTSPISFPISGNALKAMPVAKDFLSIHEMTEVAEYEEIWYLAQQAQKYQPTKLERLVNNGFDDNDGYYRIVSGDQIGYRFEIVELIGKGAFGQVLKCKDHKSGKAVAIKMVKNQKKYYYQAAVEAKLLLLLKENDPDQVERVVKLMDYFVWRNHLCIVFELYAINLYEFIKMYDYQGFEYGLIRRFAIQLLSGLRYLKHLGIIHCDLKPENILMKSKEKSGIAIADFGSGCLENEIVYTYI